jgi:hypothetical protein
MHQEYGFALPLIDVMEAAVGRIHVAIDKRIRRPVDPFGRVAANGGAIGQR